jgi:hypothetical protein
MPLERTREVRKETEVSGRTQLSRTTAFTGKRTQGGFFVFARGDDAGG